jgi:glucose-6-phosphate isomerase
MKFANENAQCKESQTFYAGYMDRLTALGQTYANAPLPHFQLPSMDASFDEMLNHLSPFSNILVLGTGGSGLGSQVLAQIKGWGTPIAESEGAATSGAKLIFADNLDPASFAQLMKNLDFQQTGILAISKSGGTPETLFQLAVCLNAVMGAGESCGKNIGAIAGPGDNALRALAAEYGFPVIDHVEEIGGRFSVLTNVGLLPAALAGLDVDQILQGARDYIAPFLSGDDVPAMSGAALSVAHMKLGRPMSVLWSYTDRLDRLGFWYRQLWAESLGKDGIGSTPVQALGPVDQHSQLQLYSDGPDDKFYTLIGIDQTGLGPKAGTIFDQDESLKWLGKATMGDLVTAQFRATGDTLIAINKPVRRITLSAIDELEIGALLMHFMLETILAADLLGINAFDQPGVEQSKILARKYLTNSDE